MFLFSNVVLQLFESNAASLRSSRSYRPEFKLSVLELADKAHCKKFMASYNVQRHLDEVWIRAELGCRPDRSSSVFAASLVVGLFIYAFLVIVYGSLRTNPFWNLGNQSCNVHFFAVSSLFNKNLYPQHIQ